MYTTSIPISNEMTTQKTSLDCVEYSTWRDRTVIADILESLGFVEIAKKIYQFPLTKEINYEFLYIIETVSNGMLNMDALDRMYEAGLR